MATAQSRTSNPTIDSAYERATDASEQLLAAARKAGHQYLDTYEKTVERAIDLELKVAGASQQEWLKNIVEAQAGFAREVAGAYASTARTLLK